MPYLLAIMIALAGLSNAPNKGSLVIAIDPDERKKGAVHIAVFQNEAAFKKKSGGVFEKVLPYSAAGKYRLEVPALAYGRYSVAVFQDPNGNGRLDTNKLGIPTEPYGFSNNPRVKWSAPTFEETAVSLQSASLELSIEMKTWKQQ